MIRKGGANLNTINRHDITHPPLITLPLLPILSYRTCQNYVRLHARRQTSCQNYGILHANLIPELRQTSCQIMPDVRLHARIMPELRHRLHAKYYSRITSDFMPRIVPELRQTSCQNYVRLHAVIMSDFMPELR